MKRRQITMLVLVALSLVLLTGCLPGDGTNSAANPAGFFWGVWHGWTAPISLVLSLLVDAKLPYLMKSTTKAGGTIWATIWRSSAALVDCRCSGAPPSGW